MPSYAAHQRRQPAALPSSWAAAAAPPAHGGGLPAPGSMTTQQKFLLVGRLRPAWPSARAAPLGGRPGRQPAPVASILRRLADQISGKQPKSMASVVAEVFGRSFDLLEVGPSGHPHLHQVLLQTSDEIFMCFRPMLSSFGFCEDVAGLAEMLQVVSDAVDQEILQRPGVVSDPVGGIFIDSAVAAWHAICFAGPSSGLHAVNERLWGRLRESVMPLTMTAPSRNLKDNIRTNIN